MDDDNGLGLSAEQMEKILQFQDLSGIEELAVCRDVLQRHEWDLEVAVQEQLNMNEGRPSLYASETRPPTVVNDHIAQQIFTTEPTDDSNAVVRADGVTGLISYVIRFVVSMCYNTVSSVLNTLLSLLRWDQRRLVTDPLVDVMNFIHNYTSKYPVHPVFYQGTYSQALNDAKRELKFLIVYLHSESASETQQFCRTTLSDAEVIEFINTNGLFWACDVASGEGWRVQNSLNARRVPCVCIICIRDGRMTLVARSEGYASPISLLQRLRSVAALNKPYLDRARHDRVERELTAQLRASQDAAYAESLAADQRKEQERQRLNSEREKAVKEAEAAIEAEKMRKLQVVELRKECASKLPPEPSDGLCLLIRLPTGERLTRRFEPYHTMEDLYNFVYSNPKAPEQFEITTNFPKRTLEWRGSLQEAGLKDRDVLFVSDIDA